MQLDILLLSHQVIDSGVVVQAGGRQGLAGGEGEGEEYQRQDSDYYWLVAVTLCRCCVLLCSQSHWCISQACYTLCL